MHFDDHALLNVCGCGETIPHAFGLPEIATIGLWGWEWQRRGTCGHQAIFTVSARIISPVGYQSCSVLEQMVSMLSSLSARPNCAMPWLAAVLALVAFTAWLISGLGVSPLVGGGILALGCILILLEAVASAARLKSKK